MSQRIIVLDDAEDELIAAERWYENRRPGLGREFRLAIDEAMERLNAAPLAAAPVLSIPIVLGARQVIVKRFPYSVIFIQHEGDLWVVAFAHQSRRPGYWRHRLNI
jgi:plasmid stabilization system protein ParE